MVLKFVGFLLVLASTTLIGIYLGSKESFRAMDLKEFKKALIILKSEIEYLNSPLLEAMQNISVKVEPPVSQVFMGMSKKMFCSESGDIYTFWQDAVLGNTKKTYLKKEDIGLILDFGKCLGHLDKNLQVNNIRFTIEQIEERVAVLNIESAKSKKMYNSMGILSGLLICIIFI
ncbi:MAG: stage III sporulation protein AB [Clostridiales bacterium]|nr:stage III sporulation protein AB [Clostridiales bacterium]